MWRSLIVSIAVVLVSCAAAPQKQYTSPKGDVLFVPDCYGCETAINVIRLHGSTRLQVFINPKNVYQYAASVAPIYGSTSLMETRQWEVFTRLPESAVASGPGWRQPEAVHIYVYTLFDAFIKEEGAQPSWIVIRGNGKGAYLVTIRQAQARPQEVVKTHEAKGEAPAPR